MMRHFFILAFALAGLSSFAAQTDPLLVATDTVNLQVQFRRGEGTFDPLFNNNEANLMKVVNHLDKLHQDTLVEFKNIYIAAGASPEGSTELNDNLSRQRASALRLEIAKRLPYLNDALHEHAIGEDWQGLAALIRKTPGVPAASQALDIIENQPLWDYDAKGRVVSGRKAKLKKLQNGYVWNWMLNNLFPTLRGSSINLLVEIYRRPKFEAKQVEEPAPVIEEPEVVNQPKHEVIPVEEPPVITPPEPTPRYFAIRTNMLYDIAAIPNLGVDIYLGKNWTIDGIWHYAWWKCDHKHRYWRTYGGDLALRKWFGSKANEKPLTGHHIGIYGQILTYDFEWGNKGYQGPRWSYGGGVEYGYSQPIGSRLNIDFTLGVGYLGGKYYEYIPIDQCYVWQATKQRHWIGPTKLEISLVWLIGRGNVNK
jgi:hypothetical protein